MEVVIIGNGISGITAAKWIRKLSNHSITVISSESDHFFSRTALMYVYMGHMRYEDIKPYEDWFWDKNRIGLLNDHVESIDFKGKTANLRSGHKKRYDKLVIATGSKSNKFGWPGQDLERVGGLYHLQDLEEIEKYSNDINRAVIVGGGLIGIEMAEMFRSRDIPVTMVVREENYWDNVLPKEEAQLIGNHIRDHHIDLRLGNNLKEIINDGNGRACGIIIEETGEKINCEYVGLTAGVSPNIGFLKDSDLDTSRGIFVNSYLETNIPDVYAVGDCVQLTKPLPGRRAIEAVWYTGRMMGETAAYNICGQRIKYDPGIWFNSAKFLDIEYQVYGNVPRILESPLDSIMWIHKDNKMSVRILYNTSTMRVEGFNLLGIRFRHEICEKWLKEKSPMIEVLGNLALANFDPEFFDSYEQEIIELFNKKTGNNVSTKSKRGLKGALKYLFVAN